MKLNINLQGGVQVADSLEFPFMASLQYSSDPAVNAPNHRCGGTIIAKKWILTAGHCVVMDRKTLAAEKLTVMVGSNKLSTCSLIGFFDKSQSILRFWNCVRARVKNVIVHPTYLSSFSIADVALLELYDELPFSATIQPIALTLKRPSFDVPHVVSGWGYHDETNKVADVLRKGYLPIVPDDKCNALRLGMSTARGQTCAGAGEGVDTCAGDSGGPLFFFQNSKWTQTGLTSYGPAGCGTTASYSNRGVYTSVDFFSSWIMQQTNITAQGNVTRILYSSSPRAPLHIFALLLSIVLAFLI